MHKVWSNYSSCTCKNSENICNNSGSIQEKRNTRSKPNEIQFNIKKCCVYEFNPLLKVIVFFYRLFKKFHLVLDQTKGTNAVFSWLYGKLE
jgi:hypothetical protein